MAESPADQIEILLRKHVENPEGRYFVPLANEYRKFGLIEEAEHFLREGLKRHPNYLSAHIVLGRCLADRGARAEAAAEFRHVLSIDPHNLIALRTLGELAQASGDLREAERWYRELLSVDPMNDDARQALAALTTPEQTPEQAPEQEAAGEVHAGEDEGFESGAGWWAAPEEEEEEEDTTADAAFLTGFVQDDPAAGDTGELAEWESGAWLNGERPDDETDGAEFEIPEISLDDDIDDELGGELVADLGEGLEQFEDARGYLSLDDDGGEAGDAGEAGEVRVDETSPAPTPTGDEVAAVASDSEIAPPSVAGLQADGLTPPDFEPSQYEIEDEDEADLVTETIAELYATQGFYDRAIEVYRQLISLRGEDSALVLRLAELESMAEAEAFGGSRNEAEPVPIEVVEPLAEPELELEPEAHAFADGEVGAAAGVAADEASHAAFDEIVAGADEALESESEEQLTAADAGETVSLEAMETVAPAEDPALQPAAAAVGAPDSFAESFAFGFSGVEADVHDLESVAGSMDAGDAHRDYEGAEVDLDEMTLADEALDAPPLDSYEAATPSEAASEIEGAERDGETETDWTALELEPAPEAAAGAATATGDDELAPAGLPATAETDEVADEDESWQEHAAADAPWTETAPEQDEAAGPQFGTEPAEEPAAVTTDSNGVQPGAPSIRTFFAELLSWTSGSKVEESAASAPSADDAGEADPDVVVAAEAADADSELPWLEGELEAEPVEAAADEADAEGAIDLMPWEAESSDDEPVENAAITPQSNGDFSFEEFFVEPETAPGQSDPAPSRPEAAQDTADEDEDLESFQAWLRSLKR
jgi:tetratricopeptide (TPR) repeat protein